MRPGEKLHEVLITEDEARTTIEMADRYVVEPAIHLYEYKSLAKAGHPHVPAGFFYRSDTNSEWMDVASTRVMLREEGFLPDAVPEREAKAGKTLADYRCRRASVRLPDRSLRRGTARLLRRRDRAGTVAAT